MKKVLFYLLILLTTISCEDHIEYIDNFFKEVEGVCECECLFSNNGLVAWFHLIILRMMRVVMGMI